MKFKKLILASLISGIFSSQAQAQVSYNAIIVKHKYDIEENTGAVVPNPTEWLSFLKSEGQLLDLDYMYEVTQ